jgi:hypothetical protein
MFRGGGAFDFSSGRPLDATPFDWGRTTETGLGIHLDPFLFQARVNEMCGLWLSYWDSFTRLAGVQLLIESAAHEESAEDDEGELRIFRGESSYLWEANGLYAPGTAVLADTPAHDVQYDLHRADVDLARGYEALDPFYRVQIHGGYLGQGRQRFLALPPRTDGPRVRTDTDHDLGACYEHVALDGSYSLTSAKSLFFGKRGFVAVPRAVKLPPDGEGDDARADNYLFSGEFGDKGAPHKVGDVDAGTGPHRAHLRAAAALDFASYALNWKGHHPFHYHAKDYHLAQPADLPGAAESLDFAVLAEADALPDPTPLKQTVDRRYGEVDYFPRDSGIHFLEDGGVVLEDGSGCRLVMAGGKVRIEAPGDIELVSGRKTVLLGQDLILRAKDSVDLSAANGDLRAKAERNLQMLAGNSGEGGFLIECRSEGKSHDYDHKFGSDVAGSGVVLRAPHSEVAALASDVYLRTGGEGLDPGAITIDAGQGGDPFTVYAGIATVFSADGCNFWSSPTGTSSDVTVGHHLGPSGVILGGAAIVSGPLSVTSGGVLVDGSIEATGSIASAGAVASRDGGPLAQVDPSFGNTLSQATGDASTAVSTFRDAGSSYHRDSIVLRFYNDPKSLGSADLLGKISFSFRDPPDDGAQYATRDFSFAEPRWQQMVRLGMAEGGVDWNEPPVASQGVQTYPWPGRAAWSQDNIFLRLSRLTMYDTAAGRPAARPGPYEAPALAGWDPTTMSAGLRTVL